jgi:hypothetical protein
MWLIWLTKLIFHIIADNRNHIILTALKTLIYDDVNGFLERNLQTAAYTIVLFMFIDIYIIIIWLSNSTQDTVLGD